MNKINVQQTGGYRLETETLDFVSKAYEIFNAFGEIAGNKTIIKGCAVVGNTTEDGFVYIDGELFPFRGGITQPTVIIRELSTPLVFQNGDSKEVFFERWVEFGTGTAQLQWDEFSRIESITSLIERIVTLENDPDDTVEPATQAEVNARQVANKYVSPATLPQSAGVFLLTGGVAANGAKTSQYLGSFTSSRQSTGTYRINHNLQTLNYGLVGSGIQAGTLKVGILQRHSTYCIVEVSDDSTLNDGAFTFQIFKIG